MDRIRDLKFDEDEYSALSQALEELATEWARAHRVSKAVAGELFILPSSVRAAALKLGNDEGARLQRIADELETLVFRCLIPDETPSGADT